MWFKVPVEKFLLSFQWKASSPSTVPNHYMAEAFKRAQIYNKKDGNFSRFCHAERKLSSVPSHLFLFVDGRVDAGGGSRSGQHAVWYWCESTGRHHLFTATKEHLHSTTTSSAGYTHSAILLDMSHFLQRYWYGPFLRTCGEDAKITETESEVGMQVFAESKQNG